MSHLVRANSGIICGTRVGRGTAERVEPGRGPSGEKCGGGASNRHEAGMTVGVGTRQGCQELGSAEASPARSPARRAMMGRLLRGTGRLELRRKGADVSGNGK